MNLKFKITLLAVFLMITFNFSHAENFPGVKQLMTDQEFMSTGLEKLNKEELKKLNQWLIKYTANDATILKKNISEVQEIEKRTIISKIDGQFNGWSGKTLFYLENGQVWKQRHLGTYSTELINPSVEIKKNILGFYIMRVNGIEKAIGVKRIK